MTKSALSTLEHMRFMSQLWKDINVIYPDHNEYQNPISAQYSFIKWEFHFISNVQKFWQFVQKNCPDLGGISYRS